MRRLHRTESENRKRHNKYLTYMPKKIPLIAKRAFTNLASALIKWKEKGKYRKGGYIGSFPVKMPKGVEMVFYILCKALQAWIKKGRRIIGY